MRRTSYDATIAGSNGLTAAAVLAAVCLSVGRESSRWSLASNCPETFTRRRIGDSTSARARRHREAVYMACAVTGLALVALRRTFNKDVPEELAGW